MMPPELPPEALVLLDEAIEALPPKLPLRSWGYIGPYKGPVWSTATSEVAQTELTVAQGGCWTIGLGPQTEDLSRTISNGLNHMLEWNGIQWIRTKWSDVRGEWQLQWKGRKLTP